MSDTIIKEIIDLHINKRKFIKESEYEKACECRNKIVELKSKFKEIFENGTIELLSDDNKNNSYYKLNHIYDEQLDKNKNYFLIIL